ncbi:MAG: DUF3048 domain-containing protein [Chloroflexota bacterium]|nr:DUF3048 domain-containing protein [Chloroflexota bacterium]
MVILTNNLNTTTLTMRTQRLLIIIFTIGLLTACAPIEELLYNNLWPTHTPSATKPPSATPAPITPSPTNAPTTTPSITPSPTLSPTRKPTYTPWPSITPAVAAPTVPTVPPYVRIKPDNIPDSINPLTGLVVPNPNLLDRLPIAVKVALFPLHTLPPAGISRADHVYEYYLEYGLTRLMAIFYGNDVARVGPVRSARIFDAHLVQMYNAAFVFGGAHKDEGTPRDVYGYLEEALDPNLFVNGLIFECTPYLCRDESISSYNNIFGNTHIISQLITQRGIDNIRPNLANNYFYAPEKRNQEQANQIFLFYSSQSYSYWYYQPGPHQYFRYQGISYETEDYIKLIDRYTGTPITAENIVVLLVDHEFYYHSSSTEIIDIQLTGSGKAYVFRDGQVFQASWERTDENKPLAIRTPNGSPLDLKPGTTFFQIMSTNPQPTQKGQAWIFEFEPPEEDEQNGEQ